KAMLAGGNGFSHAQESAQLLQSMILYRRSRDGNDTQGDHCHRVAGAMDQGSDQTWGIHEWQ
ncbi:MAG: hypothetical protein U0223_11500, partial [Nitrospira sp.]